MHQRAVVLSGFLAHVVFGSFVSVPAVSALELVWSTGSRNIVAATSMRCTLLVRATGRGESLPGSWHLSWVARATESSPLVIRVVTPSAGQADVCTLAVGVAPAGLAARADTALFCAGSEGRAALARYVLDVEGGVEAKLKLVPALDLTRDSSALAADPGEVTVNGGCRLDYSPLPVSVEVSQAGERWTAYVRGADLDRVTSVRYRAGRSSAGLEIVSRSAELLTAQASVAQIAEGGFLELANAQGFIGTVAVAREGGQSPWARDRFLVRFCAGEVEPAFGLTDGSLS